MSSMLTAPVFGAPPADLSGSAIGDFFRAAQFQPVITDEFLSEFKGRQPNWGPVGYVTYRRTYARPLYPEDLGLGAITFADNLDDLRSLCQSYGMEKDLPMLELALEMKPQEAISFYYGPNGQVYHDYSIVRWEEFWESLTRILNGLWHILRCHTARKCTTFSEATARRKAEAMFRRMWAFKWLPPGRGIWMMGTRFMYLKGSAALNNCGFVSTKDIDKEFSEPYRWLMDMSMLGVGVGFDTRGAWDEAMRDLIDCGAGAGKVTVQLPSNLTDVNLVDLERQFFNSALPSESIYTVKTRVIKTQYKLPKRHAGETIEAYQERIAGEMAWAVPARTKTTTHTMILHEDFLSDKYLYLNKTYIALNHQVAFPVQRDKRWPQVIASLHEIAPVADSREGWVASVGITIDAFLKPGQSLPVFDYSPVRPKNTPIKGFGGVAEGPEFLEICNEDLLCFFLDRLGKVLDEADLTDVANMIGACVVSGNVRRSAQIALGLPGNESFITLKHDPVNHPACWNSNNSVFAHVGMNYDRIGRLIQSRGEPGLFWIENARQYGRMGEKLGKREAKREALVMGVNPCGEQSLHNYELCCLVENFPHNAEDELDFTETLKQSYLYAKAVTLVPCHNPRTNEVMGKNSRIGASLSGIQQARCKFGTRRFLQMLDGGYHFLTDLDIEYSEWLQVRTSIKRTSIKPSGTVSLLVGCTPGIHYAIARIFIRRIRFSKTSPMVSVLREAGYRVYDAPEQPDSTVCVDFPVKTEHVDITEEEAASNIWEQLEFAAQVQALWCDNQLSITVKFKDQPASEIARALELYETRLKSVSFLKHFEIPTAIDEEDEDMLVYKAPPYQPISLEQYEQETAGLRPYTFADEQDDVLTEGCDLGVCPVR